jgi:PAS domain S-box-containing protein
MATILVIDDKETNRDVLRTVLGYKNYRVIEARDGAEGLAKARGERPDLIIADIVMPAMDGYEMVRRLRGDPATAGINVIFYTATYLREEGLRLARECGVKHLIIKPSEPQDILDTVEAALNEAAQPPALTEGFDREHLRLVSDKLLQKVMELEEVNHRLVEQAAQCVRAEEALRASEARARAVIDAATDCIISLDADGKIIDFNPAAEKTFGRRHAEVVDRPLAVLVRLPGWNESAGGRLGDYFARGDGIPLNERVETTAMRAGGEEFPVELAVTRISGQEAPAFTAYVRDISEQKLQEEMRRRSRDLEEQNRLMQAANRLKSEFLANMSHELRTPLNAIIGFSEIMHDGRVGPVSAAHKEYLGDILAAARHLLQLINDVLDLSKIEAGKMEFRPEPVDLDRLVAEVRAIVQGYSVRKRIELQLDVDASLTDVVTDPRVLKQVLYNYLSNAIKFTNDGGQVMLRVRAEPPEHFRVEVEDTGIGIAAEDIGKLFNEFQQIDGGRSKRYPGTGLGLALTKRLVEAQGGEVGVTSTVGKGSVFFAVLPRSGGDVTFQVSSVK